MTMPGHHTCDVKLQVCRKLIRSNIIPDNVIPMITVIAKRALILKQINP